jgi:hypothetical protein
VKGEMDEEIRPRFLLFLLIKIHSTRTHPEGVKENMIDICLNLFDCCF